MGRRKDGEEEVREMRMRGMNIGLESSFSSFFLFPFPFFRRSFSLTHTYSHSYSLTHSLALFPPAVSCHPSLVSMLHFFRACSACPAYDLRFSDLF